VRSRIEATVALLLEYPSAGRERSNLQVRRIVVTPYPYLLDYRATAAELVILRLRHAARAVQLTPPKVETHWPRPLGERAFLYASA
jgi:plasmid stabilization system protein ParE